MKALTKLGVPGLDGEGLILSGNVRQVLSFVESGSAPLGIVLASDAVAASGSGRARLLYIFPVSTFAAPIVYSAAVVASSRRQTEGTKLIDFFSSGSAKRTCTTAGFVIP